MNAVEIGETIIPAFVAPSSASFLRSSHIECPTQQEPGIQDNEGQK